jgi:hypothetical protein
MDDLRTGVGSHFLIISMKHVSKSLLEGTNEMYSINMRGLTPLLTLMARAAENPKFRRSGKTKKAESREKKAEKSKSDLLEQPSIRSFEDP